MNIIRTLRDQYGNLASIEKVECIPYNGARKKELCFRLSIIAEYDNNFLYHVSCHETLQHALYRLHEFSNGTFMKVG